MYKRYTCDLEKIQVQCRCILIYNFSNLKNKYIKIEKINLDVFISISRTIIIDTRVYMVIMLSLLSCNYLRSCCNY